MKKMRVALYGQNGHQVHRELVDHPLAEVTAIAAIDSTFLGGRYPDVPRFDSLDGLLEYGEFDLVSLCSPVRFDQSTETIRCLLAGKHVYAEKPAAMTEIELDRIVETAKSSGVRFHEQAGISLGQPYATLRDLVKCGALGEIVQVYAQKSYPWHEWRVQDEKIDGGLTLQVGVYCARFVEHVAGCRISSIAAHETKLGNPNPDGECRRASSFLMTLQGGGVASGVANYLCPQPPYWPGWGYEIARIWGTNGMIESVNNGASGTLALNDRPAVPLDFTGPALNYFDLFLLEVQTGEDHIPFTIEEEISPTRWAIRARESARALSSTWS